ncbi:MAG TPA: hypothetical protein VF660_08510 [Actinomycetota bacterium]|jgi:hypothetical protein
MNVPLVIAGSLALLGAAIHGGVGDFFVVRPLSLNVLPGTPFGGPRLTKLMIRATWHITTIAFVTVGCALLFSGTVLTGDSARALGLLSAFASSGFAAIVLAAVISQARTVQRSTKRRDLRAALLHPGPLMLTTVAVLAWVGVS